jgi:hypothetical protein
VEEDQGGGGPAWRRRRRAVGLEPVRVENQIRLHLERLSREDWVLVGVAAVLALDLLLLPWFSFGATINVGADAVSIGGSLTGVDAPDAWLGVLAVLACAFLIADLGFERLSPETRLPSLAADRETTRYVLACTAAGLIVLKFLFHIGRFGELAFGFWLGLLLVAGLVALTRRVRREALTALTASATSATRPTRPTPATSVTPGPDAAPESGPNV